MIFPTVGIVQNNIQELPALLLCSHFFLPLAQDEQQGRKPTASTANLPTKAQRQAVGYPFGAIFCTYSVDKIEAIGAFSIHMKSGAGEKSSKGYSGISTWVQDRCWRDSTMLTSPASTPRDQILLEQLILLLGHLLLVFKSILCSVHSQQKNDC